MDDADKPRQPVKRRHRANPHAPQDDARRRIDQRLTKGEREALRAAAEMYFIYDLNNVDVQRMSKMPQFSGIGAQTLGAWARQGGWTHKRHEVRAGWADALKRKLSDQVVHHQYDEVMKIKQLYDQAYSYALGGEDGVQPAPPKTFADAAKLVVVLDQALQTRRSQMLDSFGVAAQGAVQQQTGHISGSAAPSASPSQQMALPEMSADEYQELAHTLMAKGFAQQTTEVADDPPSPGHEQGDDDAVSAADAD